MSDLRNLLRGDLRDFAGYASARSSAATGAIWLNANESPWPNGVDGAGDLRRYPQPQPQVLQRALCDLYGCEPAQLLIGRGSDEAIDLLVRALCTPDIDAVLVTPPVFGMYSVSARLQGARLVEIPLRDGVDDFLVDLDAVAAAAIAQRAKLVFLCSPGNPAGGVIAPEAVLHLANQLQDRALVVVDEAYIEFSDAPSLSGLIADTGNLAVLRTLSKAHALAAARIGCLIAHPDIIAGLRRCQAPYPIPLPCAQLAQQALKSEALMRTRRHVEAVREERSRLADALARTPCVRRVYPSQGNFLLARFDDAATAYAGLLDAGIVVRDMRGLPQLGDALRISVGTAAQGTQVLGSLRKLAVAA